MATQKIERTRTRLYEAGGENEIVHHADSSKTPDVEKYIIGSMAVAIIPIPLVDLAAISAVQLAMLARICEHYGVPFSEARGKTIIGALVGGAVSTSLNVGTFNSIVRAVPFIGPIFGAISGPIWAGATTYALARVFRDHFEVGGTLLTFDTSRIRDTFEKYKQEGRAAVSTLKGKFA